MSQLLAGRFNRFVEKLFATKEGRASLNSISPEITVTYTMLTGVEDRYLQGWNRFAITSGTIAAVAAQFSAMRLRNPVGSGIIAVVEKLYISPGASAFCTWLIAGPSSTDLGTVVSTAATRIDARGSPAPVCVVSTGTLAAAQSVNGAFDILVSPTLNPNEWVATVNQEITILPGDVWTPQCRLANTALAVSMQWRERVLEPSELS